MKMEMTQRDKKLLVFLTLFVIIVGIGYWGIYPMIKDIMSYNTKIEEAEELKAINERKLQELPVLEKESERITRVIADAKKDYYPMMTSDEIDKLFTGMALDYNLYAYQMDIKISDEQALVEPYVYSEKKAIQDSEEENTDTQSLPATGIYAAQITMRLGSDDEEVLQKYIDDLSASQQKQLIQNYSFSESHSNKVEMLENGRYDVEVVYEKILNITMDIYMCQE